MSETIKALTIRQPWASAVAFGVKCVETRSWQTRHRGLVAIHAGARPGGLTLLDEPMFRWLATLPAARGKIPLGSVIAVAWLESVEVMTPESIEAAGETERALGLWEPGRFAWRLAGVSRITPASATGALGLWEWEPSPGALLVCGVLTERFGGRTVAPPSCLVAGCAEPVLARDYCQRHYSVAGRLMRRSGTLCWGSPELLAAVSVERSRGRPIKPHATPAPKPAAPRGKAPEAAWPSLSAAEIRARAQAIRAERKRA